MHSNDGPLRAFPIVGKKLPMSRFERVRYLLTDLREIVRLKGSGVWIVDCLEGQNVDRSIYDC